jgi:hypothetical protein
VILLVAPSTAHAKRRRRARSENRSYPIEIKTTPKRATITLDTGEVIGRTPLRTELRAGTHVLAIEKPGYARFEYAIEVTRKARKNRWKFRLQRITAIDVVLADGSSAIRGAAIYVDGKRVGTAPGRIDLKRGEHQVEVRKKGYVAYEEFVDLRGGLHRVVAELEPTTVGGPPPDPPEETVAAKIQGSNESDASKDDPRSTPSREGGELVFVGGGIEIGGRRFRYSNPQTANMRDFDASLPMVRIAADVYPMTRFTRSKYLTGLSVSGRFAIGAPVNSNTSSGEVVGTGFGDLGAGIDWRMALGRPSLAGRGWDVGGGISYGRKYFSFDKASALFAEVPDVDYRYWRLTVGAGSAFGDRYRAFGGVSYDLVRSSGVLEQRFDRDVASGIGLNAGIGARLMRALELRMSANAIRYGHTFKFADGAEFMADGASDSFFGLMVAALYVY